MQNDETVRVHFVRAKVDNFGFLDVCPKTWDQMQPVESGEAVRFCDACSREVFYCRTTVEFAAHTNQKHCVAVDTALVSPPPRVPFPPGLDLPPPPDPSHRVTAGVPLLPGPPPKAPSKPRWKFWQK